MKKLINLIFISFISIIICAQNPGDTIVVQTFDYSMTYGQAWGPPRDTIAHFPNNPNLTFEKIIMSYSMRCKDGLVNTSGGNNVACGEWDYSCHTYIHDSTRIDSIMHKTNSHLISGFNGTSYNYCINPVYSYFYMIDSSGTLILDSIINDSDTVIEFGIYANSGTLLNDIIDTISTNIYWKPYSYTYDTIGNVISIDTVNINGTINPGQLIYYKRYPMAFQIMSFVTPYGNGLDLGPEGKTWYFDLTDFAPIFKGPKKITVSGGGEWQEDMDIKFLFIVGTPPRDVVDMQQLWRPQSKGYNAIINNDAFEPRDVLINPNATAYKLRTVITGHGQDGEFIPRNHYLNIDGGAQEFNWQVWTSCGENPIYPQGGTWIYDRAGWCPGQASDLREDDITSFVNPGQIHNLDYGVVTASGSSNYWVSSQLVSYNDPNHSLDAAVIDILSPTNAVVHSRKNPICTDPEVVIQNTGSTNLTSLRIEYWVNNDINHQVYQWSGNLGFLEKETVKLPASPSLWNSIDYSQGISKGEVTTYENNPDVNQFNIEISSPNGSSDNYIYNNTISSTFTPAPKYPRTFTFWWGTNSGINAGVSETSWNISDNQGNQIYTWNNLPPNLTGKDTIQLNDGCYSLHVTDTDGDGLEFWNNNDGGGSLRFRRLNPFVDSTATPMTYHTWIKSFELDFGSSLHHEFTVSSNALNIKEESKTFINVYPNPIKNALTIKGLFKTKSNVTIFDKLGRIVYDNAIGAGNVQTSIDMSNFDNGIYILQINSEKNKYIRKIVKQ